MLSASAMKQWNESFYCWWIRAQSNKFYDKSDDEEWILLINNKYKEYKTDFSTQKKNL